MQDKTVDCILNRAQLQRLCCRVADSVVPRTFLESARDIATTAACMRGQEGIQIAYKRLLCGVLAHAIQDGGGEAWTPPAGART
jgi:hypothetical protein